MIEAFLIIAKSDLPLQHKSILRVIVFDHLFAVNHGMDVRPNDEMHNFPMCM